MLNVAAGNLMDVCKVTGVRVHVQGRGDIDPFAEWQTITKPMSVLRPEDIIGACDQALGRIEALLARAEADAPPTVGVAQMHPAVWGQATRLWRDGHYRQAVSAGADGAIQLVKSRTGRNDIPDIGRRESFERIPALRNDFTRARMRLSPTRRRTLSMRAECEISSKCCPALKMTMTPSLSMKTKMVALVATLTG